MAALGLERTDKLVCKLCKYRFYCYTNRDTPLGGLCDGEEILKLDYKTIKLIHIEKAKKHGHYSTEKA